MCVPVASSVVYHLSSCSASIMCFQMSLECVYDHKCRLTQFKTMKMTWFFCRMWLPLCQNSSGLYKLYRVEVVIASKDIPEGVKAQWILLIDGCRPPYPRKWDSHSLKAEIPCSSYSNCRESSSNV